VFIFGPGLAMEIAAGKNSYNENSQAAGTIFLP
jgi:hypothetical protein